MSNVSFEELIRKFAEIPHLIEKEIQKELKSSAVQVRDTAVKKFGKYQPAVGGYVAWEKLKESTIRQKAKSGGGEDPLIGHYLGKKFSRWPAPLRNSIGMKVKGLTAAVGTDNPLGKIHENGTSRIPPRPFLRPALYENQDKIKENIKNGIQNGMKVL